MYVDEVRVSGPVGLLLQQSMTQMIYYINTHLHFDIAYNNEGVDDPKKNQVSIALASKSKINSSQLQ
jgi:hypothetical protein